MAGDSAGTAVLERLAAIVGAAHVLTGEAEKAPYLSEWRGYYHGVTPAVVRPRSAQEISAILKLANETGTPVVPQGGNTGLVGGQIPDESGREIVLSLERLDKISQCRFPRRNARRRGRRRYWNVCTRRPSVSACSFR